MQLDGTVELIISNGSGVDKDKKVLARATARVLTPDDPVYKKDYTSLSWVCECWARSKDEAVAITVSCANALTQTTTWLDDHKYKTGEWEYDSRLDADKESWW
jgi:hypothetical protein